MSVIVTNPEPFTTRRFKRVKIDNRYYRVCACNLPSSGFEPPQITQDFNFYVLQDDSTVVAFIQVSITPDIQSVAIEKYALTFSATDSAWKNTANQQKEIVIKAAKHVRDELLDYLCVH
jgi:hypothetical protein